MMEKCLTCGRRAEKERGLSERGGGDRRQTAEMEHLHTFSSPRFYPRCRLQVLLSRDILSCFSISGCLLDTTKGVCDCFCVCVFSQLAKNVSAGCDIIFIHQ